jgi:integrase
MRANGKIQKVTDGAGLYAFLNPAGLHVLWRLDYRIGGKRKTLALGRYPEITLLRAREKALEARRMLAEGIDPSAAKQEKKAAVKAEALRAARTFRAVAEEWLKITSPRYRPANLKKTKYFLRLLCEAFGDLPLEDIETTQVTAFLQTVAAKGTIDTAHKLAGKAGEIFRYARRAGYIKYNPADMLTECLPRKQAKHRAAILDPSQIGVLLRSIDDYGEGSLSVRYALKLLCYLPLRNSELRGARWEEIDLDNALWTVPAERPDRDRTGMKTRIPHEVPLPRQAVDLFRKLKERQHYTCIDSPLCFPSSHGHRQPISDMALRNALRRMGYSNEEIIPHGFRHMFSTIMDERGENPDHIEACLAHRSGDNIRDTYNHAQYLEQRCTPNGNLVKRFVKKNFCGRGMEKNGA